MKQKLILSLLVIFLISGNIQAEESNDSTQQKMSWIKRWQMNTKKKEQEGKFLITPFVGPGYTPELGFSLAGGALLSFKTKHSDMISPRTSVPVTFGWSTKGALFGSAIISSYWMEDKLRVNANIWFKDMPDNYFGIGYDNGKNVPKSDTTTYYKRLWVQFNPQAFWQFKKGYFAGAALDLNYTKGRDACEQVMEDDNYKVFNDKPFNTGLGIHGLIDTRDIPVNAWKGTYVLAQAMFYGKYVGGQNNYQVYTIDARHYWQVHKPGQTLAFEVKGRFAKNDVPYGEMSQLGTPFDLRGYLWGQYRDKSMIFGIAEYRHSFYKSDGTRSIHGLVGWLGGGSIAPNVGEMKHWLPNGGIGYRLEVQPRMTLRLDFGVGQGNSKGFYFNFNEAF